MANRMTTLVTGASSGIGRELARVFAAGGDNLVLVARRRERLEALAEELSRRHGTVAHIIALDLTDPDAPERLMAVLDERRIEVDVLVNNAGFGMRGRFATLPYEGTIDMIKLNVLALTALSRLLLPGMLARRRGGILNVASLAAFQAGPGMALYYATKAFVLSLSEALHEEAKPYGVTVSALCPGPVETEFGSRADIEGTRLFTAGVISAPAAARAGVAGFKAGKAIILPSAPARVAALLTRFVPRSVSRQLAGRLHGKPRGR